MYLFRHLVPKVSTVCLEHALACPVLAALVALPRHQPHSCALSPSFVQTPTYLLKRYARSAKYPSVRLSIAIPCPLGSFVLCSCKVKCDNCPAGRLRVSSNASWSDPLTFPPSRLPCGPRPTPASQPTLSCEPAPATPAARRWPVAPARRPWPGSEICLVRATAEDRTGLAPSAAPTLSRPAPE